MTKRKQRNRKSMKPRRLLRKRLNYEGKLIALHKHAQQLASATSLDDIIKYTLDAIESPLGVELADFYVVDTEKECLRLVGLRGWSPSFSELNLRGPGFTVMAANSQQTVRIPDIRKEEGYVDSAGRSGKAVSTTRLSELAVPVIVEGQTVAVLNVESSQLNAFNDEDQRLLETLAVHVGSALGHLRQVEELEILARFPSENPDPVLRLDRHGTILSANVASKALLQDWGSGIGQAAPKPWRDLVTDVLSSGEGRNIDIELCGKSYTFLVKPIVEGDYVNLYGTDITDRKRMEREVRQSEERYRLITENMPGSVWLLDMNLKPTYISPNNTRIRGYTLDELYALPLDRQLTPDSLKLALESFKKALSEENVNPKHVPRTPVTEELEFYRKDGSTFWSENTFSFVRNAKGEPTGILGVGRDITDRKRAEEKLRQSEERYHSLFQGMMEGVAFCKMIFDESGRPVDFVYVDVNRAFGPLTGLEDVVGKRVSEAIPGIKETNPELLEIYGRVASTGKSEKFEVDVKPLGISLNISVSSPAKGYFVAVFENITDRKRADEKLRKSEERYHSLFERTLDGMYRSTHEGRFVDVNPAFVKMFGYSSKQEMLDIADIKKELYFSPEERGSHLLDTGQEEVEAYRMRRKDGSEIWVEDHGHYVHDEHGNIIYHEGILRDITERKHAEEVLRRRAEELAALQATVLDITGASYDLRNLLEAIVKRAVSLLGAKSGGLDLCDSEKREVRCVVSYNTPHDFRGLVLKYGEGSSGRVAETREPLIIDNYRKWEGAASISGAIELGAEISVPMIWRGQVTGVIQVIEDSATRQFTQSDLDLLMLFANHAAIAVERARVEEELKRHSKDLEKLVDERTQKLRESQEKYRSIVQNIPAVVWTSNQKGETVFVTPDVKETFGYTPEEIYKGGQPVWSKHIHPEDAKKVSKAYDALLADGRVFDVEYRYQRPDGSWLWLRNLASMTYERNGVRYTDGVTTNITERRQIEERLHQAERLAGVGETAAMVGHDLRNPLQGIAGAAYNIRKHLRDALDPSTKEMLAVIDNGVEYANGIINDLLEFSREMQLQPVRTTPKSLIRQALTGAKIPKNIRIGDTTADAPEILADEPKLKRALTNLIENAIDAMPGGGKLLISSMNTQQGVSISVRDTGVGIPQHLLERIWTPLYTTKAKGIGLGLPICRRIVEAHGGTISVESTVGKGTTFTLELPIQHVHAGGELL